MCADIYTSVHSLKLRGVLKEGWLVKRGYKVKNWKKRYFVLVDIPAPTLYYFKKDDSLQESGKIHLDATTSARPTFVDKKHMMELVTPARTYLCHAEAADDKQASAVVDGWIAAINQLTGRKLRSLSDPEAPSDAALSGDTPLAKVIESTLKACKHFYPSLNQYIALTNKYQQKISGVCDVGKSVADLMYHLGAGGVVETETGKELCKIATAIKQIETRKAEVRSAYIDHFVVKFQKTIEDEQKALLELEKRTKARVADTTSRTAKAKDKLEKAQKKNKPDQVQQAQSLYEQCATAEKTALEGVLRELLDYQEQRQRHLLVSWTEVIGAMEGVVEAETKLVQSNARWRTESMRPINTAIPDTFDFPAAPSGDTDGNFNAPNAPIPPPMGGGGGATPAGPPMGGGIGAPPPMGSGGAAVPPPLAASGGNTPYKYELLPDDPDDAASAPNSGGLPPPMMGSGPQSMSAPSMTGGPPPMPMGGPPGGPPGGPRGGPPGGPPSGPPSGGGGGGPPPPPPPPAWG